MPRRLLRRLLAATLSTLAIAPAAAVQATFVMDPFPPFTYVENGAPAGPIAEVVLAACAALRWQCRLETLPWRRALAMAEQGEVDGIFAVARIAEREQAFHLSPAVIESSYGIFVPKDSALRYRAPADLAGYTVAAYGPSAATSAVDALVAAEPSIDRLVEIDNPTLLRMLAAGRYGPRGAALLNVDVGLHLMRELRPDELRLAGRVGRIEYCIGMSRRKVSAAQAGAFAAAVRELIRSGQLRGIVARHGLGGH